jgi:hypothetical protein
LVAEGRMEGLGNHGRVTVEHERWEQFCCTLIELIDSHAARLYSIRSLLGPVYKNGWRKFKSCLIEGDMYL